LRVGHIGVQKRRDLGLEGEEIGGCAHVAGDCGQIMRAATVTTTDHVREAT